MKRFYLAGIVTCSRHPERLAMWAIADAHQGDKIIAYRQTREGAAALCAQMNRSARVTFSTPQRQKGQVA